jgi:hypothetical protein
MANQVVTNAIVCSFYTGDDYYKSHATRLKANLESLGIPYELREIAKKPGDDWADICRKKVGFIAEVCAANPDKKVFWIDVDCEIFSLPNFILNSTADIIGFQRGFSTPSKIGYENRGRFWEPCFWGINTTTQARKMVASAAEFEAIATVKATDDFFFEEAWRASSTNLTFQIIPSNCAVDKGSGNIESHEVFFRFGSSGQVANFKQKVEQHKGNVTKKKKMAPKRDLLEFAKLIEDRLPEAFSSKLRLLVDASGVTGFLTGNKHLGLDGKNVGELINAGKAGDKAKFDHLLKTFQSKFLPNRFESAAISAASSFLSYSSKTSTKKILLSWWEYPYPGNYGDWLTPFVFSHYTENKIVFQGLTSRTSKKHIISLGSVGRFIKSGSVVVGTGISSSKHAINPKADFVSVRGPHTADLILQSGGPKVESFGDPAIVLSKILPVTRGKTNGRIAFVRHYTHSQAPVELLANCDEFPVHLSHPDDIVAFIKKLNEYDSVITSAMHVLITCQSYGIPCALVVFKGFEQYVHGDGIKYLDYALGAGVKAVNPTPINPKLDWSEIQPLTETIKVSDEKIAQVEAAIKEGLRRVSL